MCRTCVEHVSNMCRTCVEHVLHMRGACAVSYTIVITYDPLPQKTASARGRLQQRRAHGSFLRVTDPMPRLKVLSRNHAPIPRKTASNRGPIQQKTGHGSFSRMPNSRGSLSRTLKHCQQYLYDHVFGALRF